jgi:hypothetical protein
MTEQPNQVQGYGGGDPIVSPLFLTQSVIPSLGEVQKQQGAQFMYKAMGEMFGTGMAVAKEAYLYIQKLKGTQPGAEDILTAYQAEQREKLEAERKAMDEKERRDNRRQERIMKQQYNLSQALQGIPQFRTDKTIKGYYYNNVVSGESYYYD